MYREHREDIVKHTNRRKKIYDLLEKCEIAQPFGTPEGLARSRLEPLMEHIACLVEDAYLAGMEEVASWEGVDQVIDADTGEDLVRARNYVKDKGLRV